MHIYWDTFMYSCNISYMFSMYVLNVIYEYMSLSCLLSISVSLDLDILLLDFGEWGRD